MKLTNEILIEEIKTLKKAAEIHTKYSISQYKKVLKLLEELEKEKKNLEKKVEERTKHLKMEIEENMRLNRQLEELANYDALTKLLNRRAFREELNKLEDDYFSVMFLDLDGFKQVNDIYGHKVGDELLKVVAKRIINALRKSDVVGRLGGDEFVILIKGKHKKKDLEVIAKKLIDKISSPIVIDKITAHVGTSIGIYMRKKEDSVSKALSFADAAMYEAKRTGKGKYVFFSPILSKHYLQKELKKALKRGELNKRFELICYEREIFAKELIVEFENIYLKEILEVIEEDKDFLERFTILLLENLEESERVLFPIHYKLLNDDFLEKIKGYSSNICLEIEAKDIKYVKKEELKKFSRAGFSIVVDKFEESDFALAILEHPIDAIKIDRELKKGKEKKIFEGLLTIAKNLEIKVIFKCPEHLCIEI